MQSRFDVQHLLTLYRTILTIRAVENSLSKLFADGEVPGFIHLSTGQEAIAGGICIALGEGDTLTTTHRGHGHVLARGLELEAFYKEIMGKAGGICCGRGGSMHVADMRLGILGANGIVGAGIPIALGSALAHRTQKTSNVAVAFFGDGAMAEGVLHETLNMAALWKLPLLLVCENNGWSEFSPTRCQISTTLEQLATAFGIRYVRVDGNDVQAVATTGIEETSLLRQGDGPAIIECVTRRVRGHYEGDPQKYRDAEDFLTTNSDDPVSRAQTLLRETGVDDVTLKSVADEVDTAIHAAIALARQDADPDYGLAYQGVYATR